MRSHGAFLMWFNRGSKEYFVSSENIFDRFGGLLVPLIVWGADDLQ